MNTIKKAARFRGRLRLIIKGLNALPVNISYEYFFSGDPVIVNYPRYDVSRLAGIYQLLGI